MLSMGGSAADAMIAAQAVLGLVESQSSGIGGDGFVVYADALGVTTFDGRTKAPAGSTPEMFDYAQGDFFQQWQSGVSVGVPGMVQLMEDLHGSKGVLDWSVLFQPAIELAEEGFPLSLRSSGFISTLIAFNQGCENRFLLLRDDAFFDYFVYPNCTAKPPGTIVTNQEYADTLKIIASEGAEAFYNGPIAEDIAAAVQSDPFVPGSMTVEDLAAFSTEERQPVCATLSGNYEVCGMGPPSTGGMAVGQILGILDNLSVEGNALDATNMHLFTQATRLAFTDRAYVGDPDFVSVPSEGMLDMDYIASRAAIVNTTMDTLYSKGIPPGAPEVCTPTDSSNSMGTSQISVLDTFGNALSATTTVQAPFGNGVMVRGFLLNNMNVLFDANAVDECGNPTPNGIAPNKRPFSSMSPTIVLKDGEPILMTGSPGGTRIIGYTAKSVWNVLTFGLDPQTAIDVPHYQNNNDGTSIEFPNPATLPYNVTAAAESLTTLGHDVSIAFPQDPFGNMNSGLSMIYVGEDGVPQGGADKRRDNSFELVLP